MVHRSYGLTGGMYKNHLKWVISSWFTTQKWWYKCEKQAKHSSSEWSSYARIARTIWDTKNIFRSRGIYILLNLAWAQVLPGEDVFAKLDLYSSLILFASKTNTRRTRCNYLIKFFQWLVSNGGQHNEYPICLSPEGVTLTLQLLWVWVLSLFFLHNTGCRS